MQCADLHHVDFLIHRCVGHLRHAYAGYRQLKSTKFSERTSIFGIPTLIEHIVLDCQICNKTKRSQCNKQVVKIQPFQEPHTDCNTTNQEDACRNCADVPGHLRTQSKSILANCQRGGKIKGRNIPLAQNPDGPCLFYLLDRNRTAQA